MAVFESGAASVSGVDGHDETPLCIAASRFGSGLPIVKELQAGPWINAPDPEDWSLLLFACANGLGLIAKVL